MDSLLLIFSRKRYFAPVWVFASLNILVGTWVLYIPRIKEKLNIDDGEIGIALFCYAMGVLVAVTFASKVIDTIGVGKSTWIGITIFALLFLLPLIASSYVLLCITLLLVGVASSFTDIAMNALIADIEKEDGVHFMSAAHAFFSLGGVIGAGIGSLLISYVAIPVLHMLGVVIIVIMTNTLLMPHFIGMRSVVEKEGERFSFGLLKPLLGLTIISFIVMGSEGSLEQWSKLYLEDIVLVSSERLAGFGFVIFSAAMAVGRLFGDRISTRFGSYPIMIAGLFIGLIGYGAVLSKMQSITLLGFGLVGIGFSVIIPELFRLAGRTKGISSSQGISFVAGMGFVGFMAGPAVMGFLADRSSLWLSYMALGIACAIAFCISIVLKIKSN